MIYPNIKFLQLNSLIRNKLWPTMATVCLSINCCRSRHCNFDMKKMSSLSPVQSFCNMTIVCTYKVLDKKRKKASCFALQSEFRRFHIAIQRSKKLSWGFDGLSKACFVENCSWTEPYCLWVMKNADLSIFEGPTCDHFWYWPVCWDWIT